MVQLLQFKNSYTTIIIALVWFINGLFCKVLNLVPRHEQLVAAILDRHYARELTLIIGLLEIGMSLLILLRFKPKLLALFQIFIILIMNSIELYFAPTLLLWGKMNIVYAIFFCLLIYRNDYRTKLPKGYGVS